METLDRTPHTRGEPACVEDDPLWMAAAAWFIELRSEHVSSERIAAWLRWLNEDSKHQKAFDGIVALRHSGQPLNTRWPSESEAALDDYAGEESISAWRERSARKTAPMSSGDGRLPMRPMANSQARERIIALAAALVLGGITLLGWLFAPTLYAVLQGGARLALSTEVGEMRALTLPDGSQVTAGGQTSFVAIVLKHSRRLILERGEVFLRVAKDHTRPFTVRIGNTSAIAVGTAFDVRRISGEAVVAVAEGIVRVSAGAEGRSDTTAARSDTVRDQTALLRAGQQWRLDGTSGTAQVSTVDADAVADWREGRLQYLDEPLALVVTDLARYSSRPIRLNRQVAKLRMTGVVFPNDLDAWLSGLEVSLPVRVFRKLDGRIEIEQK